MRILNEALLDKGYEYKLNLEKQFDTAIINVEKEMAHWYQRFAKNNDISLAEAKRLLNTKELEEFRWSVEEYISKGESLDPKWLKQLENASARVHISRLDTLKLQMQQQVESLYSSQLGGVGKVLRNIYEQGYYRNIFEVQKGVGIGTSFQKLNDNLISKALARPWTTDGRTFSDRIWANKESLVNTVNNRITQMLIRGEAPDKAISEISKQFNVSKNRAGALVMTESAALSAEAQKDCYDELDIEQYKIVESLDTHTCAICGAMDGKVVAFKDFAVGTTAPPFHTRCRGTTCPYYEDMEGIGERWARDADGKSYKVPNDMTYEQWREKYVDDTANDEILTTGRASGKIGDTDGYTIIDDIREIDINDKVAVQREIDSFRDKFEFAEVEHSVIITQSGKVYELMGTEGKVNPAIIGTDELKGSIGAHNHPVLKGGNCDDSFSSDDVLFSVRHKTGMEYLVSGTRRDAFLYTGDLSEDNMYEAYAKAKNTVDSDAWEKDIEIKWKQADIMRELSKTLKGFMFYENL